MSPEEIGGFIFALIGILLSIKQNKWNWIANIMASIFYFVAFMNVNLVADAYLQWFFVGMGIWGFINWNNAKYNSLDAVSNITKKELGYFLGSLAVISSILIFISIHYTPSDYPYWDGVLASASICNTYLLVKKKIETWIIWGLIDLAYMPLYYIKSYYLSILLYGIYVVLVVVAYREWKKYLPSRS